jgi:hypothetical protein
MYEDLTEHGFVVVPNFLNEQELTLLIDQYSKSHPAKVFSAGNFLFHDIQEWIVKDVLTPRLKTIIDNSPIFADQIIPGGLFTDTNLMDLSWHQDHGTYIFFKQHYDLLKFYIPIIKPDEFKSGLSVVSFKTLSDHDPEGAKKLIGIGATSFYPEGDTTKVINDDTGKEWFLNVNIDDIKVSPYTKPGDLLLCRGDIIHRTQDTDTHRVAIALHSVNGNIVVSMDNLIALTKDSRFEANRDVLSALECKFKSIGKDRVNLYEWYKFNS